MTRSEFSKQVVEPRLEKIRQVLADKGDEYAVTGDFDCNFIAAARVDDETPERALWGMAKKHLVSVTDLIHGRAEVTPERIDEKIGDMINYLILLEGLLIKKSKP